MKHLASYLNKACIFFLLSGFISVFKLRATDLDPSKSLGHNTKVNEGILKGMLCEAATYARRLNLNEEMPLTRSLIRAPFTTSAYVSEHFGALGSFHTEAYSYGFGSGGHLTYIKRLPQDKTGRSLYERFKPWAIAPADVNTNAAFIYSKQVLDKAFVDIKRLSKGALISITPLKVLDLTTSVCIVEWKRGGKSVAEVSVVAPKRELWSLRIEDSDCILRPPITAESTTN